jgi:pyruvate kinase
MFSATNFDSLRRTRIIATLGPATNDRETVTRLLESGVNIIRLNMSHGSHEDHQHSFELVRQAARSLKLQVAIFVTCVAPRSA